jgi:NAD(P) transhydrogenase subunit beta
VSQGLVTASYIIAAVFFILSLAGLSKQETAKNGNLFGIIGMAIALIATILNPATSGVEWIILAMVIGGSIGIRLALKVEMTEMPELVAILHSFVGLAAVLVGFNSFIDIQPHEVSEIVVVMGQDLNTTLETAKAAFAEASKAQQTEHLTGAMLNIHLVEVFLGIFIGAVTFTGSIVAFAKLRGLVSSKALMLPHRHKLNLLAVVVSFILMVIFVQAGGAVTPIILMTLIAFAFGWHLVAQTCQL